MSSKEPIVNFVHAVDTEGPLSESLDDTFERLKLLFDIDLQPDVKTLQKLQNKEIDLNGKEESVANCISPKRLNFINNLDELDRLLDKIFSSDFRKNFLDSFGNPYRFSWFCIDHVGFKHNPRKRLLGYHSILKNYIKRLKLYPQFKDTIQWHYHSVPFNRSAHSFGLNWSFDNCHINVFTRRLIDFNIFASAYRAGGWIERPDMHFWLEQWIPFDYSNHSIDNSIEQPDYVTGRFADWSRASKSWCGYHPSKKDYQIKGDMNRCIFRSLSLDARIGSITEDDIELAFEEAVKGKNPILSVTNHDCRDIADEIENFWPMLKKIMARYPKVKLIHSNEIEAAQKCLSLKKEKLFELKINWVGNKFIVKSNKPLFGPQPFLAFKTINGDYYHDNMAYHDNLTWSYEFDWMTVKKDDLVAVAVASSYEIGDTSIKRWDKNI